MNVVTLSLKTFRNHKKCSFSFPKTTIIVGENTAGKTSLLEALWMLSHGKSFKADKDIDVINGNSESTQASCLIESDSDIIELSIIIASQNGRMVKKYLVNGVARRLVDFSSNLLTVLFTPEDLEVITDSPSLRRNYINSILNQVDKKYRVSFVIYEKALKRRNRMLYLTREDKKFFGEKEFEYWDNLLIEHGQTVTKYRNEFVNFVNSAKKDIFSFQLEYDKSIISRERLDKYKREELAAATTLVGPQRDDFIFKTLEGKEIKEFSSRGEQRLTILQLKLIETIFLIEKTEKTPVLLLDDIFSELDDQNIERVFELLPNHQVIITTTHNEFIPKSFLEKEDAKIIEL